MRTRHGLTTRRLNKKVVLFVMMGSLAFGTAGCAEILQGIAGLLGAAGGLLGRIFGGKTASQPPAKPGAPSTIEAPKVPGSGQTGSPGQALPPAGGGIPAQKAFLKKLAEDGPLTVEEVTQFLKAYESSDVVENLSKVVVSVCAELNQVDGGCKDYTASQPTAPQGGP